MVDRMKRDRREDPARYLLARAKSRAKRRGEAFNLTRADIAVPKHCPVFGVVMRVGGGDCAPSLDKILPHLGYTKGNVVVISNRANRIKDNASLAELTQLVKFLTHTIRRLYK